MEGFGWEYNKMENEVHYGYGTQLCDKCMFHGHVFINHF